MGEHSNRVSLASRRLELKKRWPGGTNCSVQIAGWVCSCAAIASSSVATLSCSSCNMLTVTSKLRGYCWWIGRPVDERLLVYQFDDHGRENQLNSADPDDEGF